jgi:RNA polymerase sigma-54 factor
LALEMKFTASQQMQMRQQQIMTPQMQQAIKLLQYNQLQLLEHIQTELVENVTLEEIPGTNNEETSAGEREMAQRSEADSNDVVDQNNGADTNETDWQQILEGYSASAFKTGTGAGLRDDLPPIESTLSSSQTLVEHLLWQLHMQLATDGELRAAHVILLNLDDKGYLMMPLDQVAEEADCDLDDAEGAQMIVQGLDPIGCGSSSLEECLVVQAQARFSEDPFFKPIILNHLKDFESRNYQAVARAMDMDLEDVIEYHRMIRELEPWPGRGYADADPQYITPDVYVFKIGDEWQIRLNEDGMPKLRVSPYYKDILKGQGSKEDRKYIKDKLESADFLIKSIYRRQMTILKVMKSILRRQQDFFDKGVEHLHPMILRDVADEIGVHESTVSRTTTNKYVECPFGIFELKYFFNARISTTSGTDAAAASVKAKIQKLVDGEDRKRPLSDQAIANVLKKEDGINCARRTVAKYREALGILPSSKRKQLF